MSIEITTLPNGVRIVTDTMPDAKSVVVGAWVGVGTRHEPRGANGVAHLVEHMLFKGTRKRSAYALSAEIENKGGSMNAHTSREETAYYARVLPEAAESATDIIADMLRHSVFNLQELDRERQVIIQEIGHDLDSPEDYASDLMHQVAFPRQRIGRPILGSANIIAALPRRVVVDWVKRYYTASNMVLVAAGQIAHPAFVSMVKQRFGTLPRGKKPVGEEARVFGGTKFVSREIEQAHVMLAFPGCGYRAQKAHDTTQILSMILGGNASSRLFQKVREKRGLVYAVHAAHSGFADTGLFQIYAGTDPQRVRELMRVICAELKDVQGGVKPGELQRAKEQMRADILMGEENVARRAGRAGSHLLMYGEVSPVERVLRRIASVSSDDVQKTAARIFKCKPILAAVGPLDEMEDHQKIAERLAS